MMRKAKKNNQGRKPVSYSDKASLIRAAKHRAKVTLVRFTAKPALARRGQ